jgi:Family of unknown function (DUF6600)
LVFGPSLRYHARIEAEWGWYWAADEEWGWITYHYGRWVFDREFGWIWVPADEWGPAWVRWRRGGTHIGWCPLPPDDILAETDTDPDVWIFVEAQDLVTPEIDVVVLAFAETAVFIRQTVIVNQTIIVRNKNVVVAANPGVPPSFVAAALKRPIQTVTVRPAPVSLGGSCQFCAPPHSITSSARVSSEGGI